MAARTLTVALLLLLTGMSIAAVAARGDEAWLSFHDGLACADVPRYNEVCRGEGVYVACSERGTAGDYRCFCDPSGLPSSCSATCRSELRDDVGSPCRQHCREYLIRECQPMRSDQAVVKAESDDSPSQQLVLGATLVVSFIVILLASVVTVYCCCCKSTQCQLLLSCRDIVAIEENRSPYQEMQGTRLL